MSTMRRSRRRLRKRSSGRRSLKSHRRVSLRKYRAEEARTPANAWSGWVEAQGLPAFLLRIDSERLREAVPTDDGIVAAALQAQEKEATHVLISNVNEGRGTVTFLKKEGGDDAQYFPVSIPVDVSLPYIDDCSPAYGVPLDAFNEFLYAPRVFFKPGDSLPIGGPR